MLSWLFKGLKKKELLTQPIFEHKSGSGNYPFQLLGTNLGWELKDYVTVFRITSWNRYQKTEEIVVVYKKNNCIKLPLFMLNGLVIRFYDGEI